MLEFQQFQDKIRKELQRQMKYSRDLIDLRDREQKLVRVKRYEEAEKVKMKADLLEEFERNKLEAEVSLRWLISAGICRGSEERIEAQAHAAAVAGRFAKKDLARQERAAETQITRLAAPDLA